MHVPVLLEEVLEYLDVQPNRNYIDATVNGGGHARAILEKSAPNGKILGIDWDPQIISKIKNIISKISEIRDRLIPAHGNFKNIASIVDKHRFGPVHGVLFDLGLSSEQLEKSGRGFTFQKDEPLDMRYDDTIPLTAADILNTWPREKIAGALTRYGEERFAKNIARKIEAARDKEPFKTTFQLVALILDATPGWYHRRKIHAATKTFQALRIVVNDELENLSGALPQALERLEPKGRLVVIGFHSLEDRVVKNFFRDRIMEGEGRILTKKPAVPTLRERRENPRARSAKLRAFEKI